MSRKFKTVEDLKYFLNKILETGYFLQKSDKIVISVTLWGENDAPCDVTHEIYYDDDAVLKVNNFYEWLDETKEILGEHAVTIDDAEVIAKEFSPKETPQNRNGMMTTDEATEAAWEICKVLQKMPKIENPKKSRGFFGIFNKWGKNK